MRSAYEFTCHCKNGFGGIRCEKKGYCLAVGCGLTNIFFSFFKLDNLEYFI